MSDIEVSNFNWSKLKKSKNAFFPRLLSVLAPMADAPTNKQIADAAREAGAADLSQHRVGDVMNVKPVKAGTIENVLMGYLQLRKQRPALPEMFETDIVVAVLAIPKLGALMKTAGMEAAALSEASGVSFTAVEHAVEGGRVSAGIAGALWNALADVPGLPPLGKFAESNLKHGRKTIELVDGESPLTHDDLLLPVPKDSPSPWA